MKKKIISILPIILGVAGAAILYSYITPWVVLEPDSATYLRMAEEIQKGRWHIDQWGRGAYSGPPIYPILVGLLEWVVPGFDIAGTIVAVMAASIAVIPLFVLARKFYGEKAGWAAIPLTILIPLYVNYVSLPLTESLFIFFSLVWIVLTYLAVTKNMPKLWFLAGVVGGVSWLIRDVGIILPVLSFLWFGIRIWKGGIIFPQITKNGVALILGILLVSVPLKIVMAIDLKAIPNSPPPASILFNLMMPELTDSTKREIYTGRLNEDSTEYALVEAQKVPPGLVAVVGRWTWILKRLVYNVVVMGMVIYNELGFMLLLFILAGIVKGKDLKKEDMEWRQVAPLLLGSYALLYLFFYALAGAFTGPIGAERYLVPLVPLWGIWAAAGILWIGKYAGRFKLKHLEQWVVALCVGIVLINFIPGLIICKQTYKRLGLRAQFDKKIGTRVRAIAHSYSMDSMVIMGRNPYIPYYAGALWFLTPYADYPEILKFAKARHVDFLYMDEHLVRVRPQLNFLLDSMSSSPGMERVLGMRSQIEPDKFRLVLYRVIKE